MKFDPRSIFLPYFAPLMALALSTSPAQGADFIWDGGGGDNDFGTAENWVDDLLPSVGSATVLKFTGTTRTTPINDYTAGDSFGQWRLLSGAGANYTITGNAFTLHSKIENDSGSGRTFTVNTGTISAGGSIELNPVGGDLIIGAGVSLNNNASLNVYDGGGSVNKLILNGVLSKGTSGGNTSLILNQTATVILAANGNDYGTTTINTNTKLQVGNGGSTGSLGTGSVTNNGTLTFNRTGSFSVGNTISGSGTLTQAGSDTLTLTTNNTYSGNTIVNAGILAFSGSGSVYNNGGSAGSIIVNNGGTLKIDRQDLFGGHTSVPTATITVNSGGLVTGNANYNTLNNLTLNGGTFQTANGDGFWGSFALKGTVTAGGTSVSSTISSGGTTNNYIRIGTNVAAGATIFNVADSSGNANTDLTISAQLRDSRQLNSPFNEVAGALTKSGVGTLTLSGANAYSGGTTINNGILSADTFTAAGSNSSIGTGALTLNGGTFRYTGASSNANDVLINRTINVGTNGGTLEISSSGNYFGYGGSFSGSGTLTVTGSNKELLYTGTSSGNFTGNIIVGTASANSGLVQYRSNNANAFGTGSITINAGGTFSADSGNGVPSTLANNFILNGGLLATQFPAMTYGGTISLLATSTIGNVATYNGTLASTGAISGSGGVIISSGSSVTLSGNNTYSGGTTVNAGTLKLGHVSALGATSGTVNLNGGTLDLNGQSVTQSAVVFNGGVQIATGSGTLSLSSTGTAISFTGTPTTASATGTISLTGVSGGNIIKSTTAGAPVLSGALNLGGVSRTVALADTGGDLLELSLTNQVSNGGLTLDNGFNSTSTEDWGTLGLLGTNTYDGITTITKGRVVIDNASSLGSAVGGTTIGTRGTLAFGGAGVTIASGITVAEALTISRNNTVGQYGSAAIQNNSGANTMSGAVSLTANATIDVVGGSLQFSNTISQTATSSLTKIGTGTLTLSGENAYSGGTTLSGGTLAVRNNSALGTGTLNMGTGTALTNSDTAAHSLTNNIVFGSGTGMAATLFANSDLTLNGALSGGSSGIQISVQGPGTVTVANSPHNLGSGAAPAVWTVTGGGTLALTQGNNFGNLPSTATTQVILNNGTFKTIAANAVFFSSRGMQVNAAGGTWHDSAGGVGFDGAIANSGPFTVNTSVSNATSTLNGAVSGSGSLIKTGAGTLTLSATNGFNGATMVNEGTLRVTGSITNSAVTVSNAGTTIASGSTGTIGSSLTVNSGAILAAGDAAATGTATVTGATTLNNGSIFSWDISSNGAAYDKLVTASLAGEGSLGDAVFRIVAADSTFANTFWNQSRTWTDIFTTNGSNAISDWAGLFSVAVVNSSFQTVSPVNGSFSVSGSTLTWSAVPEVSNVLVGGLLGLGMLRRRRDGGPNLLPRKVTSRSSLHN